MLVSFFKKYFNNTLNNLFQLLLFKLLHIIQIRWNLLLIIWYFPSLQPYNKILFSLLLLTNKNFKYLVVEGNSLTILWFLSSIIRLLLAIFLFALGGNRILGFFLHILVDTLFDQLEYFLFMMPNPSSGNGNSGGTNPGNSNGSPHGPNGNGESSNTFNASSGLNLSDDQDESTTTNNNNNSNDNNNNSDNANQDSLGWQDPEERDRKIAVFERAYHEKKEAKIRNKPGSKYIAGVIPISALWLPNDITETDKKKFNDIAAEVLGDPKFNGNKESKKILSKNKFRLIKRWSEKNR